MITYSSFQELDNNGNAVIAIGKVYDTCKGEQPLFISFDDCPMFEGEEYWAIDPKDNEIVWSIADYNSLNSNWLKFAEKENAEIYLQHINQ